MLVATSNQSLTPRDKASLNGLAGGGSFFGHGFSKQHSAIKPTGSSSVNQSNLLEETIMSIVEKCVN